MTGRNSYAGLDPYLESRIRIEVHQLIGKFGLTEADRLDLQQDLVFGVLRKMKQFDPQRSEKKTYMAFVLGIAIKDIIRLREAQCRHWLLCQTSLDEELPAEMEEDTALLIDSIRRADLSGRESLDEGEDGGDELALRLDLERVLASLPEDLRTICERLKHVSLTELERETGIPRSTIFYKRKLIRRAFAEAGLQIYLKKNSPDSTRST